MKRHEPTHYASARFRRDAPGTARDLWSMCVRCATPERLSTMWQDQRGGPCQVFCNACKEREEREEQGKPLAGPASK